jgi:hypothetical protein
MRFSIILFVSGIVILFACKSEKKDEKLVGATKTETAIDSSRYLIDDRSMGKIKVGMTKLDVLNLYPTAKEDTVNLEAEVPCLAILDADSTILFQATYEGTDTIRMLITESTKMRSASGVKVGSLYTFINTLYPDLTVSQGEGYFGISEKGNIMFALEGDIKMDIVNEETMEVKLKSVSPETKATMILIK